jgi:hypothetical protein
VSPGYLREKKIDAADPHIAVLGRQGKTVIFVLIGDELKGLRSPTSSDRSQKKPLPT